MVDLCLFHGAECNDTRTQKDRESIGESLIIMWVIGKQEELSRSGL